MSINNQEINTLKRITMSLTDIQYCIKYLEKVNNVEDEIIKRALDESIIISYVRPFNGYNKTYHNIKGLKQEFKKSFTNEEVNIHNKIFNMRNTVIAHSDEKSYSVNIYISKLGDSNFLLPFQRRIPFLLSDNDIEILKTCCMKIEKYLFKEQHRIRELLPIGSY